jgi:methionyl aminopeptidase
MSVSIKSADQLDKMRVAGRLASEVLDMIGPHIQPGVTTDELDRLCHSHITEKQDAVPAPLNYKGFPRSICTSVNNVVCHGIPGPKVLKAGDIVNVDITVIKNGFHGDTSRMYYVGEPGVLARRLCTAARDALHLGIEMVKPGLRLGEIGKAIQRFVESQGFSVVRDYCGHGIGEQFHEDPQVLHYFDPRRGLGPELVPGMTFTIEPMVNAGGHAVRLLPDGWTVVTKDRSLSAQWEHTIAVTDDGAEILTAAS